MPSLATLAARFADLLAGISAGTALVRASGPMVAGVVALLGLVALTLAGRAERVLAGLGGAVAGALAALAFRGALALHLGISVGTAAWVLALLCGLASAGLPRFFPFAAAAVPSAVLGLSVPLLGRPWAGALLAGLVGGLLAAAFARGVSIVFASLAGGLLFAAGGLGLAGEGGVAAAAASRPLVVLGLAVALAVAGAAFQLPRRPPRPSGMQQPGPGGDRTDPLVL